MSSVFGLFTASDAVMNAPGAPFVVAAALMAVTLLLFDVPAIREVFAKVWEPLPEPASG